MSKFYYLNFKSFNIIIILIIYINLFINSNPYLKKIWNLIGSKKELGDKDIIFNKENVF